MTAKKIKTAGTEIVGDTVTEKANAASVSKTSLYTFVASGLMTGIKSDDVDNVIGATNTV